MLGELVQGEIKAEAMGDELLERILHATRNRVEYVQTDIDNKIDEGSYLYTDIYAKFGTVVYVVSALKKWGRRSFRILKLGTEIINFIFDNSSVDVRSHFIKLGGVLLYKELVESYLLTLSKTIDVEVVLGMSKSILDYVERF